MKLHQQTPKSKLSNRNNLKPELQSKKTLESDERRRDEEAGGGTETEEESERSRWPEIGRRRGGTEQRLVRERGALVSENFEMFEFQLWFDGLGSGVGDVHETCDVAASDWMIEFSKVFGSQFLT
ncbi:hypothetical protein SLA2020_236190 [Shorea laevis]